MDGDEGGRLPDEERSHVATECLDFFILQLLPLTEHGNPVVYKFQALRWPLQHASIQPGERAWGRHLFESCMQYRT